MKECSKSIQRRLHTPAFSNRYFVGNGVDIGGKPDPLGFYKPLFGKMESCKTWDLEDGDAQYMPGCADSEFDFVHSSHCLEHMRHPEAALRSWLRILKPGGYLIVTVPDEDMYEQGQWPSRFNKDHKWTFTIHKQDSWSPNSINLLELLANVSDIARIVSVARLEDTWLPVNAFYDQTMTIVSECGIEFVLRKNRDDETLISPDREMRIQLNQYADDRKVLRAANIHKPPFANDAEIARKS